MVAGGDQAVGVDVVVGLGGRGARVGALHGEEILDILHLAGEGAVRQVLALGGEPAGSHPAGILLLLLGAGCTHESLPLWGRGGGACLLVKNVN